MLEFLQELDAQLLLFLNGINVGWMDSPVKLHIFKNNHLTSPPVC